MSNINSIGSDQPASLCILISVFFCSKSFVYHGESKLIASGRDSDKC